MSKYIKLQGEIFPYEEPQYKSSSTTVTGRHFWLNLTAEELPETLLEKLQGVISVKALAETKVLEKHPEYAELTSYGTRRAGYWKLVNAEVPKRMFRILNVQAGSVTLFVNKITGLSFGSDSTDATLRYLYQGLTNGVWMQVMYPYTGYSCLLEPVYNKKKDLLFTKRFLCEKALDEYNLSGALPEGITLEVLMAKVERLRTIRTEKESLIMDALYSYLQPYRKEWTDENLYTLPARAAYVVETLSKDVLDTYYNSFQVPTSSRITLEKLKLSLPEILLYVQRLAPAFGIDIRTWDNAEGNLGTLPKQWSREDRTAPNDLKQVFRLLQRRQSDPLPKILEAYIQINWYMSQENRTEWLDEGWSLCPNCNEPVLDTRDETCPKCLTENPAFIHVELLTLDTCSGLVVAPRNAYEDYD